MLVGEVGLQTIFRTNIRGDYHYTVRDTQMSALCSASLPTDFDVERGRVLLTLSTISRGVWIYSKKKDSLSNTYNVVFVYLDNISVIKIIIKWSVVLIYTVNRQGKYYGFFFWCWWHYRYQEMHPIYQNAKRFLHPFVSTWGTTWRWCPILLGITINKRLQEA